MKPRISIPVLLGGALAALIAALDHAGAEQFGPFTYRVIGETVEIIDYPNNLPGHVDIPAEIDGRPVTAITGGGVIDEFDGAFSSSLISSVTIPDSVTVIGDEAFGICFNLTEVTIPDSVISIGDSAFYQSNSLRKVEFGNGVRTIGDLAFFKCFRLEALSFPASLDSIGDFAFEGCSALDQLAFADGIESIGRSAFIRCTALKSVVLPASVRLLDHNCFMFGSSLRLAVFLGDAPTIPGNTFDRGAADLRVLFPAGAVGFTTPEWRGFPAQPLDAPPAPVRRWLLENGLPMDADLTSGSAGTTLLLAYALGLDPKKPAGGLEILARGASPGGIRFFAGRPDVTYAVPASSDLDSWSTAGVTVSEADVAGMRSARAAAGGSTQFFRIEVSLIEPLSPMAAEPVPAATPK